MGWSSSQITKKETIEEVLSLEFSGLSKVLKSSVVGNNIWQLVEQEDEHGNLRAFIALTMMSFSDGRYWIKHLTEACGPVALNCPVSMIEKANTYGEVSESVKGWRECVVKYKADKKRVDTMFDELVAGDTINFYGKTYTVISKISGTKGCIVSEGESQEPKATYRMQTKQVKQGLLSRLTA